MTALVTASPTYGLAAMRELRRKSRAQQDFQERDDAGELRATEDRGFSREP